MRGKADPYLFSQNYDFQKNSFGQELQLTEIKLTQKMTNTAILDFEIIIVIVFTVLI